ncbi:hypothetical protein HK405_001226 [Cladochytrium tenue]|nr:hypothetical protein HK405_001226 [Cladochytrium tenue]
MPPPLPPSPGQTRSSAAAIAADLTSPGPGVAALAHRDAYIGASSLGYEYHARSVSVQSASAFSTRDDDSVISRASSIIRSWDHTLARSSVGSSSPSPRMTDSTLSSQSAWAHHHHPPSLAGAGAAAAGHTSSRQRVFFRCLLPSDRALLVCCNALYSAVASGNPPSPSAAQATAAASAAEPHDAAAAATAAAAAGPVAVPSGPSGDSDARTSASASDPALRAARDGVRVGPDPDGAAVHGVLAMIKKDADPARFGVDDLVAFVEVR